MDIKKSVMIAIMIIMVMTISGCGKKEDEVGQPKVIRFGIQRMPNDETLAIEEGLFDKYFTSKGIEVKLVPFDSGSAVNTALASGSIDFGLKGSSLSVLAKSLDIDIDVIWIHEILGTVESLAVKDGSGIEKIEDLVGKRVATPVASTAHYSLLNALKIAGIEDEVEVMDMQPSDIVAAWSRGDIEATYVWQPALGELLKDGKILLSSEDMAEQGVVTANVEVVSKKFAEKYPEIVNSYIACLSEAGDIYRNDPKRASEIIGKALDLPAADALVLMKGSHWPTIDEQLGAELFGTTNNRGALGEILKDTADFLEGQGSIRQADELDAYKEIAVPFYMEEAKKIISSAK